MIKMVYPLSAGNALKLFLEPPATAVIWRILRKGSDTFVDQNDPGALVVYEGNERLVIDTKALVNGVRAYYRAFHTADGLTWTPSETAYGTPNGTFSEVSPDVQSFVRERLELGLAQEVQRGEVTHALGYIPVFTASPVLDQQTQMPLVTVHLDSEESGSRVIGEQPLPDYMDHIAGQWQETAGWLADVRLTVIAWTLNSDERLAMRQAIRRVLMANLPIFDGAGFVQISISQQDVDAVNGEYPAPIYQAMTTFSCTAPVASATPVGLISDVLVTGSETQFQ